MPPPQRAEEVNVNFFRFGAGVPESTDFLPNATIADHLATVKKKWEEEDQTKHVPEAFAKALAYAARFPGAVATHKTTAVDDLFTSLTHTEFVVPADEDVAEQRKMLHKYEGVALINLNPSSIAAAKGLVPSLERFTDEELETLLKLLRAATVAEAGLE